MLRDLQCIKWAMPRKNRIQPTQNPLALDRTSHLGLGQSIWNPLVQSFFPCHPSINSYFRTISPWVVVTFVCWVLCLHRFWTPRNQKFYEILTVKIEWNQFLNWSSHQIRVNVHCQQGSAKWVATLDLGMASCRTRLVCGFVVQSDFTNPAIIMWKWDIYYMSQTWNTPVIHGLHMRS